jgi:hypothetical protein
MSSPFTYFTMPAHSCFASPIQKQHDVLLKLFVHKLPFTIPDAKLEMDYLRFIYLKVVTQDVYGTIISPTTEIDEVWHTHLLHNKNYLDMCLNINFIVYHYPEKANDTEEVKNKRIEMFKKLYYQYFKTIPYDIINNISSIAPNNQLNETISQESDSEYSAPVTIFIKTVTNKNITIEISLDCSIAQLKNLIFFKENIPVETQKLIFAGKRIDYDNKKTLREFNIQNHSTIHIMFLLKGC